MQHYYDIALLKVTYYTTDYEAPGGDEIWNQDFAES